MKVEIKEIEFNNPELKSRTENYPSSGFYISSYDETIDLTFVNKNFEFVLFIIPVSEFEKIESEFIIKESNENINQEKEYTNDFILEFARILLNRK